MKRIIAILGSTGVGKSSLANALARKISGEIVVCDSIQFYKNYKVSSNWPSEEERSRVNYVNLGKLDCFDNKMDTFKSNKIIRDCVKEIHDKGKIPVVEGGCMLSFHQFLTNNLFERDKDKFAQHKKTAKDYLQKIQDRNIRQCNTDQQWNEVCLKIQSQLGLPTNSLNTMNRNDVYRLENKIAYVLYDLKEGENPKNCEQNEVNNYDSRIFVLFNPGSHMAEKIHRRCLEIIKNGYFQQIVAVKKGLKEKKITIDQITTPLGADKAMHLLTLASDPHTNERILSKELTGFFKTYQDITRSYYTKQKKYLQKFFKNAIWIQTNENISQQVRKIQNLSKTNRKQYERELEVNQLQSRDMQDFSKAKCMKLSAIDEKKIIAQLLQIYKQK